MGGDIEAAFFTLPAPDYPPPRRDFAKGKRTYIGLLLNLQHPGPGGVISI